MGCKGIIEPDEYNVSVWFSLHFDCKCSRKFGKSRQCLVDVAASVAFQHIDHLVVVLEDFDSTSVVDHCCNPGRLDLDLEACRVVVVVKHLHLREIQEHRQPRPHCRLQVREHSSKPVDLSALHLMWIVYGGVSRT